MAPNPQFFASPEQLRAWFAKHHDTADELIAAFHKKGTGKASITWPEAVDEALCVGWIDSVRRSLDEHSYTNRFTPRRARSVWSAKNIARFHELTAEGRVAPPGQRAFDERDISRTNQYSFEQERVAFDRAQTREFRANEQAWAFFRSQPPSYRTPATWWVVSAKKDETKARRLATLIDDSEHGLRVKHLRRP